MRRRWSSVLAPVLGLGLSLLGCRPPPPTIDPSRSATTRPSASKTVDDDLAAADATAPKSPLDLARALPADTKVFLGFADPFSAADALGRRELVARLAKEHASFANETYEAFGFDLTSPEALADFGLAPHRPGGYARLEVAGAADVLLFTVADRPTLRARLFDWTDREPAVVRFGEIALHGGPRESGVVVHRGVAMFILDWGTARDVAKSLSGPGERARLDRSPPFQAAFSDLPRDVDAALFVDALRFVDQDSAEARLLEGLAGLGATARFAVDRATADVEIVLRADSPLRAVADALRPPSPQASALERFGEVPPVMAFEFAFDPAAAFTATKSLFDRAMERDDDAGAVFEAVRGLLPYVTGEVGVMCRPALATVVPRSEAEFFYPTRCQETYVVGLRDPEGARRVLERLTTSAGGRMLTRVGRDFEGRGVFGTFRIAVREQTLLLTEDLPGLAKLAASWPEAVTWNWARTGERAPIEYRLELDRLLREIDDDTFVPRAEAWVRPELPQEPAAARSKRRELDRLLAEQDGLERQRAVDAARMRLEAARRVGAAAVSFSPSAAGLRGQVTVRPGGASFGETWVAFADAIATVREAREREDEALKTVQARIETLRSELEAILSLTP